MASLLNSALVQLRAGVSLPTETKTVRIRVDGSPLDCTGQTFIALHKGSVRTTGVGRQVETYTFYVTISIRQPGQGAVSPDRDDVSIIGSSPKGIDALVELVKTALGRYPGNYLVISEATTSRWIEAPYCSDDGGQPSERWKGWLSQTLTFDGAKRDAPGTGIT